MLHICLIPPYSLPDKYSSHGGIGSFTRLFVELFASNNFKVTLIEFKRNIKNTQVESEHNFTHVKLKFSNVKGLQWLFNSITLNKQIKNIHKENPIDIIETAEQGLAFIRRKKNIKYVIRLHGGNHFFSESENRNISVKGGILEKISFRKANGFIAVSNFVKVHTNKYLDYYNKPLMVLPSPINTNKFKPKDVKLTPKKIVFAGRLCEKKGLENLILAINDVKKQFLDIKLYIFGKDSLIKENKKSYKMYLEEKVLSKIVNSENFIHFKNEVNQDQLIIELLSAHVCVFPSFMETQGLVALEAMALEKLVVFTELGPGKELIDHKKDGVLCNPHDYKSIAKEIIWCLNLSNNKKVIIEKDARKKIIKNYNETNFLNKNLTFFNSL